MYFQEMSQSLQKIVQMENFILKWVGSNSSVAGLPFLEREVERSKPRVVCLLALGPVDAVNVTTILSFI